MGASETDRRVSGVESAAQQRSLDRLTWPQVGEHLQRDDHLLLVIGACEQHGPHLPFTTDVDIPWEIAQRASRATGALLAPPIAFGMSLHHMEFPGTLSLRPQTLIALLGDLLTSAHAHGFRRLLIVNGHGGNRAALQSAAVEALYEHRELEIKIMHWFEDPQVLALCQELFGGRENHASAVETACMLAIDASRVQMAAAQYSPPRSGILAMGPRQWRECYPYGSAGLDPRLATAEAGERLLQAAAGQVCRHLEQW